jgi:heat shock protein HslJ
MNKFKFWIGIFLLILTSCEESNVDKDIDLTANNWKVTKIRMNGELNYISAIEDYIFEFTTDTTYTFNLDMNRCGGSYKVLSAGSIELNGPYCTMVCCDSDFALMLLQTMHKITTFYGIDNKLVFKGQGEIIFTKVN